MTSGVGLTAAIPATPELAQPVRRVAAPLQHLHQRGTDHDAIDVIPQQIELLAAADAEARAHGHG